MSPPSRQGIPAPRGAAISQAEFARMWADKEGWPLNRIAERLGITVQGVRSRARTRGLPPRTNAKPTLCKVSGREEVFRSMWLFGVRTCLIARHFGAGSRWPERIVARLGLPPRRRGHVTALASVEEWADAQTLAAMRADAAAKRKLAPQGAAAHQRAA